MPSNQTQNYHLNQWEKSDKVLMEDFNADNAVIDAAIKAVDEKADGKTDVSAFNSLTQTVNSHTTQLAKRGNCKIETRSYTGTGTYGDGTTISVTFSARPMVFFIMGDLGLFVYCENCPNAILHGSIATNFGSTFGFCGVAVNWSGSQAKITIASENRYMNTKDRSYQAFAFIPMG